MTNEQLLVEDPAALEGHELRRAFGGVADISALQSDTYVVASAAELNPNECFVRTWVNLIVGMRVNLRITYEGQEFNAPGEVAYILAREGVGITFNLSAPKDAAILEEWVRATSV